MVKYARNELLSVTAFTKQIGTVMSNIREHSLEKIGILKNNKLEAVVISTEEYERLKEIEELAEQIELYKTIQERKKTPLTDYLSMDEMATKFDINMEQL